MTGLDFWKSSHLWYKALSWDAEDLQSLLTCFLKDKLQSIVTPSRSDDFWVTIQWPLREIGMPEVSCFDLVKMIALNLSGLTIM